MSTLRSGAVTLLLMLLSGLAAATTSCQLQHATNYLYGKGVVEREAVVFDKLYKTDYQKTLNGEVGDGYAICDWDSWKHDPICAGADLQNYFNYARLVDGFFVDPATRGEVMERKNNIKSLATNYTAYYTYANWAIYNKTDAERWLYLASKDRRQSFSFASCWTKPSTIAYLNGVFTTRRGARLGLNALSAQFGKQRGDAELRYELLYNQTECTDDSKISCLGDLAETFEQRQAQLDAALRNRWELFWDAVAGRPRAPQSNSGALLASIGGIASSLGRLMEGMQDALVNKALELTTSLGKRKKLHSEGYFHAITLHRISEKDISTVVVAHSQGNLFVDSIKEQYPLKKYFADNPTLKPLLSFVHVAPPTSVLQGPYVLADIDGPIRSLRELMSSSIPAANVTLPISLNDMYGHGFVETYMDPSRPAFGMLRGLIDQALEAL